jgi:hypothetical protein
LPRVSSVYGAVIAIFPQDHHPPHFHARSAGQEMKVSIDPIDVMEGDLPPALRRRVLEWAQQYQSELLADWDLVVVQHRHPIPIPPAP